jgi:hypothetical protein
MIFDVISSVVVEKKKEHKKIFLKNAPLLWRIKDVKKLIELILRLVFK